MSEITESVESVETYDSMSKYAPRDGGMFGYSRKQAGVIYAATKRGDVTMSREQVRDLYDYADGCSCGTTDAATKNFNWCVKAAVSAIFAGDYASAQELLDEAFAA